MKKSFIKKVCKNFIVMKILSFTVLSAVIVSTCAFSANAAAYSGKGTKSNPYLVQSYEQLQGIKDNLSAHYKLANTIDCSGQTLQPVGFLAQPFTGTFTCDTNADGTPQYAIKNLTVSVQQSAYSENNSKWEAGLFGCTSGATISNIAILNASIGNMVIGQNQMNPNWSKNPGQDEQASGVLVGIAKKTKIQHCSSTGKVEVKTNHTGGLIGRAVNSTITYCYSTVAVTTSGLWSVGGLIGSSVGGSISYSYATGNVTTLATGVGGLAGDSSSSLSNCYSTGTLGRSSAPVNCGSLFGFGGDRSVPKQCENCYSISTINGLGKSPAAADSATVCLILNEANHVQGGFKPASMAEIASAFSSKSGWTVSNGVPTIADIAVITNEAAYIPGAIDSSAVVAESKDNATETASDAEETSSTDEKKYTAEEMTTTVDTLMEEMMSKKGLSQKSAFVAITLKDALAKMDTEESAKLSSTVTGSIDILYDSAVTVLISTLTVEIDKLPAPKEVTSQNAEKVLKVWEKYKKLPEDLQEGFTDASVKKLKECYEAAKQYENVSIVSEQVDSATSTLQTILIIILSVLNLAALAGVVLVIIRDMRLVNQIKEKQGLDISETVDDAEGEVAEKDE